MTNINTYAEELLLDFYDAVHSELSRILEAKFGGDWIVLGIRKHFKQDYFERVEKMLRSPMRAVEMDRNDDEIYGIEHIWNIIGGNWTLFKPFFEDKLRIQTYLGEVTELRHNLAHRKKRHLLLRSNLIRILGSCHIVLSALKSPHADNYSEIANSLSAGITPWGSTLDGRVPPSDEMYVEFIGRPAELEDLSQWLSSDSPQILVWGYGGVGKSALAYKFAKDVKDSSSETLIAVCWVSAKKSEFSEGSERIRAADFANLDEFTRAVWTTLYGEEDIPQDLAPDYLAKELQQMPILLVVDDFDTISEDLELTEFLFYGLRNTLARVIYTSRHRTPGIRNLEVPAFSEKELREFVSQRSVDYSLDQATCLGRLPAIKSVTGGYPLFVDDLIHHAKLVGIDEALRHWSQRKGDAARQYALQRQVEHLGQSSGEVLIALSVANRSLKVREISAVAGLTEDDAEAGISALLQWRMVNQAKDEDTDTPVFRMNNNTSRLVQQTFRDDSRMNTFSSAFRALTGERVTEAKRVAIAKIINWTMRLLRSDGFLAAEAYLRHNMTGELEFSPDLYSVLGKLYSHERPLENFTSLARRAFEKSHQLGSSKLETYFYWAQLERNVAESIILQATGGGPSEEDVAKQWKRCEQIAETGIDRCGLSQPLCYLAGYSASREAKARMRANSFAYAQGAYVRSISWFDRALTAPISDVATIGKGTIYRGLTLAYEGLENEDELLRTLKLWQASSGNDPAFVAERRRLRLKYRCVREVL